jgi:hypothetical protein
MLKQSLQGNVFQITETVTNFTQTSRTKGGPLPLAFIQMTFETKMQLTFEE